MWYKFESKAIEIYLSEDLIRSNPNLSTDLCAGIVTSLKRLSYWDLLDVFQNNDIKKLKKVLKGYEQEKCPVFKEKPDDNVVGCLLQKKGRKNITNTYFIHENNTLFVSKSSKSENGRCKIIKDEVIIGEYLFPKLSELINKRNIVGFEALFIASIESVFKRFKVDDNNNIIKSEAIDCIAKNTIITNDGFDFFDIEYSPDFVLTKSHFLFRCALGFSKQYINRRLWPYKSPYTLYIIFCNYFSIIPDVDHDIDNEIRFLEPILDSNSRALSKNELKRGFYNKIPFVVKLFRWIKDKVT